MNLPAFVRLLESFAPPALTEPWDNTGLLLEPRRDADIRKVLLTIDLTAAVAREARAARVDAVVAYHPPLFHAVKRLTHANPMQSALLDLATAGIAVYSPHTALDAAPGGVNDWLASLAGEGALEPIPRLGEEGAPRPGSGRRNILAEEVPVTGIVERMADALGTDYLRVALAVGGPMQIRSVAVCAGSGASALRGAEADVWITGEMSHHDVLAATAAGVHVILSEHTRTERGYLPVLKERLVSASKGALRVMVSKADRCPLTLIAAR